MIFWFYPDFIYPANFFAVVLFTKRESFGKVFVLPLIPAIVSRGGSSGPTRSFERSKEKQEQNTTQPHPPRRTGGAGKRCLSRAPRLCRTLVHVASCLVRMKYFDVNWHETCFRPISQTGSHSPSARVGFMNYEPEK